MSRLSREREPEFGPGVDDDGDVPSPTRPRRRRGSWLTSVIIVLALSACGVGGYYLADSLYLASQRLAPSSQGAATPVEPAAETPAPANPATPGDQALAQPAVPAATPVATPTGRRIGSWTLVCPGNNSPRTDCALVQRLVDAQKRPVLVWSVTRDGDGTVRAMWQTSVDVDRKRGLVLDAGDGKPRSVPFAGCAEQYCLVRGILAPNYLPTLVASPRITVAVSNTSGQPATYAFAAAGLADGLAWLGGAQ